MSNGSRYFQIVEAFARAIAKQNGQTLHRIKGPRAGWKTEGVQGVPDIAIHWKREALSLNDKPPRIVCVANGAELASVDQPGGGISKVGTERLRTIMVRRFGIQCYVWGQDDEQSEDLYYNSIRAFRHLFSDGPQPGKAPLFSTEVWENELPGAGGQSTHGEMISFVVTFELTVQNPPDQLVIVKQVSNELTINNNLPEANHVTVPR